MKELEWIRLWTCLSKPLNISSRMMVEGWAGKDF